MNIPDAHKSRHLPGSDTLHSAIKAFKPAERLVFFACVIIFVLSALIMLEKVNRGFMVVVPTHGGTLVEGVVGTPRFVNPLLATTEADKSLTALVYSGLMKKDAEGNVVPDLAQSYAISDDGLTYTFILKSNAVFQDGTKVTADDIVYTVNMAENDTVKSPRANAWAGVAVAKVDSETVTFTLKQPYGFFLQNTTLGILPSHLWSKVAPEDFASSNLNSKAVGSGPFEISHVSKNSSGVTTGYTLGSFNKYISGEPLLGTIKFKFFASETDLASAVKSHTIDSAYGLTAADAKTLASNTRIESTVLPRIFGVFFNQSNAALSDSAVRSALAAAVDKDAIVQNVLQGFGTTISSPIPQATVSPVSTMAGEDRIAAASALLTKAGWTRATSTGFWVKIDKKNPKNTVTLSFSLATGDTPELKAAAESVAQDWQALGVAVNVHVYDTSDLNQNIIRPRKYDALLFGEVVGWQGDLYPFWDSSQTADPGLNIARYNNPTADTLLENARATSDDDLRAQKYDAFADLIASSTPAVFLYSPDFIYAVPYDLHNLILGHVTDPSDRFAGISGEYRETDTIWKLFNH